MGRKSDAALKAKSAGRAYGLAAFVALCLVRQPAPAAALHRCAAQVLVQIGAYYWPTLPPGMTRRWSLTEAGWITSAFHAAYMASVPVLLTLTDRIDGTHCS